MGDWDHPAYSEPEKTRNYLHARPGCQSSMKFSWILRSMAEKYLQNLAGHYCVKSLYWIHQHQTGSSEMTQRHPDDVVEGAATDH